MTDNQVMHLAVQAMVLGVKVAGPILIVSLVIGFAISLLQAEMCIRDSVVTVAFEPIQLTSHEVLDLQVGDVLPLRHPTNQPLTLSTDGVAVGAAVPGSHGSRLACQIVTL